MSRTWLLPFKGLSPLKRAIGREREGKERVRYWERDRLRYGARGDRECQRERPTGKWIELDNRKGKGSEKGAAWWERGRA